MLSKYLDRGDYQTAKNLSRVGIFNEAVADKVESYAGFITVNQTRWQSQIFFWFFPAEENAHEKPLLVWLQVCILFI